MISFREKYTINKQFWRILWRSLQTAQNLYNFCSAATRARLSDSVNTGAIQSFYYELIKVHRIYLNFSTTLLYRICIVILSLKLLSLWTIPDCIATVSQMYHDISYRDCTAMIWLNHICRTSPCVAALIYLNSYFLFLFLI